MELTSGIFKAAENIYKNNKGSILRTCIYTIGHFAIAIVEPLANAVWYFILDKWWASRSKN